MVLNLIVFDVWFIKKKKNKVYFYLNSDIWAKNYPQKRYYCSCLSKFRVDIHNQNKHNNVVEIYGKSSKCFQTTSMQFH